MATSLRVIAQERMDWSTDEELMLPALAAADATDATAIASDTALVAALALADEEEDASLAPSPPLPIMMLCELFSMRLGDEGLLVDRHLRPLTS